MIIFIAIPSKGTVKDGALTSEFLKKLADLHVSFPEHTFISPMVQDYALLPYMKADATWEDWGFHCRNLIEVCSETWVLMYEGWQESLPHHTEFNTSVGVFGEIEHSMKFKKPIRFIKP